jgi:pSer/pThr/pTyr-binding forkhead associated (FHA) protein
MFDNDGKHQPLVYVRDRDSTNGTWVNDRLIHIGPHARGHLLIDGDVITILPRLRLTFHQPLRIPCSSMTILQQKELVVRAKLIHCSLTKKRDAHSM